MGCSRCEQRRKAMAAGVSAVAQGKFSRAGASAAFVARTLAQDARSGALRTAATNQLAQLRNSIKRR